jgi:hypothetical protein
MQTIYLEPAQVPTQWRGSYSGKSFKAVVTESMTIPSDAGLWAGGSRDVYRAMSLETGEQVRAADHDAAPWDHSRRDQPVALRPGFAVVRHSIFCGKDMGLTFYIHPDNAAKLLSAPDAELTELQQTVLDYTRSRKSSYNGQDRYDMAKHDATFSSYYRTGEKKEFATRAQWDEAKAALFTMGLLDKRGAITVKGRNRARSV